jgi:hypothetical protein
MKGKFIDYLKSLGMTEIFQSKVSSVYDFFEQVCPEPIADIFVNDYVKEDGSREYPDLFFFSKTYCMSADEFITKDDFDMVALRKKLIYWNIEKRDYDFKRATEKSRLRLQVTLEQGELETQFRASRDNCDYLKKIFHTYIVPNLIE